MGTSGHVRCAKCGHAQQDGSYCEACGGQLVPNRSLPVDGSLSGASTRPSSHRSGSVVRDLLICFAAIVVGAIVSRATWSFPPFLVMLILALGYWFLVRKWLRLTKGIPGSQLVGAGMLALLLAIVSFVIWLFRTEGGPPAYVFIVAFGLAVVLFGAAWYVREQAKRAVREEQLLGHMERLQPGTSTGRAAAPTITDPPVASNLSELVAMPDRGLLTPEEFQVAKMGYWPLTAQGGTMVSDQLICPKCGHAQPEGEYCELCGASVSQRPTSIPGPRLCPHCGKPQADGAYCKECGVQLGSPQVPAMAQHGSSKQHSSDHRAGSRLPLVLVWIAGLALIAAIVTLIVIRSSEAPAPIAKTTTTQMSAVPETLPPIQTPTPLSLQDFQSVSVVKQLSSDLLQQLAKLADLVGRYPNWNQNDVFQFSSLTGKPGTQGILQMLATNPNPLPYIRFTPAFEQTYRLGEGYRRATSAISPAASLIAQAVNSRDASMFEQARSQLAEATTLLSSVAETADRLDAHARQGNIQSGAN